MENGMEPSPKKAKLDNEVDQQLGSFDKHNQVEGKQEEGIEVGENTSNDVADNGCPPTAEEIATVVQEKMIDVEMNTSNDVTDNGCLPTEEEIATVVQEKVIDVEMNTSNDVTDNGCLPTEEEIGTVVQEKLSEAEEKAHISVPGNECNSSDSKIMVSDDDPTGQPTGGTCERKYGMTCILNQGVRLSGIIKQRHTDFIVRECDPEGNVVQLTDLNHIDAAYEKSDLPLECPVSDEMVEKIRNFVESGEKTEKLVLEPDDDKDHRKLVHKYIKELYKQIETDTVKVLDGSSRAVELSFKSNKPNSHQRKPDWMKNLPKFCHFVLYKEGRTTMECINTIARMIHSKPGNFTYAGTKDRRAATVQRVCLKNGHSKQLSGLNQKLQNVALGNFSYRDTSLNLGDLSGNKFTIVIRDVVEPDEKIDLTMTSMKEKGFINYFGLQRFGSGNVSTHKIGKVLLQSKFEEAVNMILHLTEDMRFEGRAKRIWHSSRNAKDALRAIKSRSSIEGKILEHLSKQSGKSYNYFNAFQSLPRNNRLIYLHSYQSFIWNTVVSTRLHDLGKEPCVGDLVMSGEKDDHGHEVPTVLTEENVKQFTIYDVVLPLPGFDVQYPTNKLGLCYQELLSKDGIDLGERHKTKELSLSGTYRHMVVKPKDMLWKIRLYDDYTIPLVKTDIEKVKSLINSPDDVSSEQGIKYKGVCLDMTLPTSCYATSALREVLVSDSSYDSQVTLNENFIDKQSRVNDVRR